MTYTECKIPECGNPVFAGGLCRKHYDRERLETAPPCSCLGCTAKAFRGTLCEAHYRAKNLLARPLCVIPNCGAHQKNLTSGLCGKHEFRSRRHGSTEQTRPADWGSREAHPLYATWTYHRRLDNSIAELWANDFWLFVKTVGDKPEGYTLRRSNTKQPLGPDNWVWKESTSNKDPALYQRIWRKHNPEKAKHHNLKRQFGITLIDYEAMAEAQNWSCAICGGKETTKDKDGGPRMMPVDHDHKTGKVRALLCTQCNRGLGMFSDNIEKLKAAAAYLEKHVAHTQIK